MHGSTHTGGGAGRGRRGEEEKQDEGMLGGLEDKRRNEGATEKGKQIHPGKNSGGVTVLIQQEACRGQGAG